MRFATVNIKAGANGDYFARNDKPRHLRELQKALHRIDAEVIVITDSFRWTLMFTEAELCAAFNVKQAVCINTDDTPLSNEPNGVPADKYIGITVLIRDGGMTAHTIRCLNRNFVMLDAMIDGRPATIVAGYGYHASEKTRSGQFIAMHAHVGRHVKIEPHADLGALVFAGDSNTINPASIPWQISVIGWFIHHFLYKRTLHSYGLRRLYDLSRPTAAEDLADYGLTFPAETVPTMKLFGLIPIAIDQFLVRGGLRITNLSTAPYQPTFTDHRVLVAEISFAS